MKHTRRSWTPRSGWRLRDRLDKAWRWPLYSRGRAIGTLTAAILVVVIWPQGAGSEQATVAAATATNPTAQTSEATPSERSQAQARGPRCPPVVPRDQGTNLTASPPPPTLTTSPEQYRTAEAVATQYLQVWCWQPAAAPANSNLTNTAPWITPAGQADDLTRSATSAAIPDLDLRPRHRHTDRRATQHTGPDPAPTVDPTGLHQHIRRHRQPAEDRTDTPNRPRPGRPLARRHAGAGRMKAVVCCHHARYRRPGPGRGDHPRLQRTTISTIHREQQHCDTRLGVHLQLHRPRSQQQSSGHPRNAGGRAAAPGQLPHPAARRGCPDVARWMHSGRNQPGIRATSSPIRCSTTAPR